MNEIDVLKKIVENDGSCTWAKPSICKICPMSRLKKKNDKEYVNCIEALGAADVSEDQADKLYLDKAKELLLDKQIEDMLKDR